MRDSARYSLKTGKSSNKRVTIASKLMGCQGAWQAAVWWVRRTSFFICRWTLQTASSSTFYARKRSIGPKENDWDERVRQCVKATLCLTEYDKVLCVWSVQVARGAVDHATNAVREDLSLRVWCIYFYIAPDIFSLILCPDINGLVITLALSVMAMFAQFQLSPSCLLLNSCELPGPGRWCSWAPCLWLANPENQSQSWQDHSKSAGAAGVVNRQTVPTWPLMSSLWRLFCLFFVVIFILAHKTHTKQSFFQLFLCSELISAWHISILHYNLLPSVSAVQREHVSPGESASGDIRPAGPCGGCWRRLQWKGHVRLHAQRLHHTGIQHSPRHRYLNISSQSTPCTYTCWTQQLTSSGMELSHVSGNN